MASERRTMTLWKRIVLWMALGVFAFACVTAAVSLPIMKEVVRKAFDFGSFVYVAPPLPEPTLDYYAYNKKMVAIAGYGTTSALTGISATSTAWTATSSSISSPRNLWPVKTAYPDYGAILPFSRIVAYYGNFKSTAMGILGELPPEEMTARLEKASEEWAKADPSTPVIPALDYIAVVAQGAPGKDGMYRLRMPDEDIRKAISLARGMKGLTFIDVQVGKSTLQAELPLLAEFLKYPDVELALDPEFSMKHGNAPGTVIGTMSAADVNYAAEFLAKIVKENDLPPKVLLVHRFTEDMLTDYKSIAPLPQVEIAINMDGWGGQSLKLGVYRKVVSQEPVQFGAIKLFYKNDLKPPSAGLLTPKELLELKPRPMFVEYQ